MPVVSLHVIKIIETHRNLTMTYYLQSTELDHSLWETRPRDLGQLLGRSGRGCDAANETGSVQFIHQVVWASTFRRLVDVFCKEMADN